MVFPGARALIIHVVCMRMYVRMYILYIITCKQVGVKVSPWIIELSMVSQSVSVIMQLATSALSVLFKTKASGITSIK